MTDGRLRRVRRTRQRRGTTSCTYLTAVSENLRRTGAPLGNLAHSLQLSLPDLLSNLRRPTAAHPSSRRAYRVGGHQREIRHGLRGPAARGGCRPRGNSGDDVNILLPLLRRRPPRSALFVAVIVGSVAIHGGRRRLDQVFSDLSVMKVNASPEDFSAALNIWIFFARFPVLQPVLWISKVLHGSPWPRVAGFVPVTFLPSNVVTIAAIASSPTLHASVNAVAAATLLAFVGAGLEDRRLNKPRGGDDTKAKGDRVSRRPRQTTSLSPCPRRSARDLTVASIWFGATTKVSYLLWEQAMLSELRSWAYLLFTQRISRVKTCVRLRPLR